MLMILSIRKLYTGVDVKLPLTMIYRSDNELFNTLYEKFRYYYHLNLQVSKIYSSHEIIINSN